MCSGLLKTDDEEEYNGVNRILILALFNILITKLKQDTDDKLIIFFDARRLGGTRNMLEDRIHGGKEYW